MKVTILDHGYSNLGAVLNMLDYCGADVNIEKDPNSQITADRLIIPGVGSFDAPMSEINRSGYKETIIDYIKTGNAVLGICVGMQILTAGSEEGNEPGLNLYEGPCVDLSKHCKATVYPHMRWNSVSTNGMRLFKGIEENKFYFAHSYGLVQNDPEAKVGITDYSGKFISTFEKDNIMGVQFHPEKSHAYGIQLFDNFLTGF